jgi:hypothetical protein
MADSKSRKLKTPEYKSFKLSKRIKHPKRLPGAWKLFRATLSHIFKNWRLFLGIVAVYFALTIVLVKGFGFSSNIPELKSAFSELFGGTTGALTTAVSIFGFLVGSTGSTSSDVASVYQSLLLITVSLALIWALRQSHAKIKVNVKEAFYKGLYPFVPFLLVLLVIGLQLVPLLIGNWLYGTVISNGIAISGVEKAMWALIFFFLALLSLYLVSSSVFALYIVTLPDMQPMQALRSARELVRYRRWAILVKVLFLPIALLVIGAVIIIPLIWFVTWSVAWVFFAITMLALAVVHGYMYSLYRELL